MLWRVTIRRHCRYALLYFVHKQSHMFCCIPSERQSRKGITNLGYGLFVFLTRVFWQQRLHSAGQRLSRDVMFMVSQFCYVVRRLSFWLKLRKRSSLEQLCFLSFYPVLISWRRAKPVPMHAAENLFLSFILVSFLLGGSFFLQAPQNR